MDFTIIRASAKHLAIAQQLIMMFATYYQNSELNMSELACVIIEPLATPKYAIIWLHGLGADGHDFEPLASELSFPQKKHTRFIFPHAPIRPVTINGNMPMRAWYDIIGIDFTSRQDQPGIQQSASQVTALLEAEHKKGIAYEDMILAGFSQGGALTLATLLSLPHKIRGAIALSCYLPIADHFADELTTHNIQTPIFMAHGDADPVVQCAWGEQSFRRLQQWGQTIEFKRYPMQHSLCPEEIMDIDAWLTQQLQLQLN